LEPATVGGLVGTGEGGPLGSRASTTTAGMIGGGSGGADGGSASGTGADSTELLEVITDYPNQKHQEGRVERRQLANL